MSEFNNVTIIKKANVYFDGKVVSRTLTLPDCSVKTLGYTMPGEYDFNTAVAEVMEILDGQLDVLLPGSSDWVAVKGGGSFNVPANSNFQLKIHQATDYCCSFVE